MADPITWRSVGSSGFGSAGALLNMGQQQVSQGLDAISSLFRDQRRLQEQNFQRERENNTASYLDAVASAGGVDALQNPETRAQLEAMRAGFGAAIDRNITRGAIDNRIAGLQDQARAAAQYEDIQTERAQRGLIDQGVALAQAGDMEGVNKLLADNQFLNEGRLANELTGIIDAGTRRQYAAEDQARQARNETRQIAQFNETMAAAKENRVIRNEARRDAKEERDFRRNSRILDDAAAQAQNIVSQQEARNPWAAVSTNVPKDTQTILKGMEDGRFDAWVGFNDDDRREMTKTVSDLLANGVEVDGKTYKIPPAMIMQELAAASSNTLVQPNSASKALREHFRNSFTGNAGAQNRALVDQAEQTRANALSFVNTLKRAKTQIGTSSSMDTSGIVAGLAALAGGTPVKELEED